MRYAAIYMVDTQLLNFRDARNKMKCARFYESLSNRLGLRQVAFYASCGTPLREAAIWSLPPWGGTGGGDRRSE